MLRATTRLLTLCRFNSPQTRQRIEMSSVQMNGHLTWPGVSLSDLPKSHIFTTHLPADPVIPSPQASKEASPQQLRMSRPVKGALFTWVAPESNEKHQLLTTSWKALRDLGLDSKQAETEDFLKLMSGNKIYEEHYPWGESLSSSN
jgi:hypothetical protein